MALQVINRGAAANDGTGDLERNAWIKANANFLELYNATGFAAYPHGTTKFFGLGDSMIGRGIVATGATFTQIASTASSPIHQAMGLRPGMWHQNYWEPTATIAAMVPTYAAAMSGDQYFRGANFGIGGDLSIGIQRRTAQIISMAAGSPAICFVWIGTNTDSPDSAEIKIPAINTAITSLIAAGIGVVLMTIAPRWLGDTLTVVGGLTTSIGTKIITVPAVAHGISSFSDDLYMLDPVNVSGVMMGGGYLGGSVTVVDADNFTISCGSSPSNAAASLTGLGGTVRFLINRFTFNDGTKQTGFCPTPARTGINSRPIVHSDVNKWIVDQYRRAGVIAVIDLTDTLCDPARQIETGFELAAAHDIMAEGVHINPKGALAVARKIVDVVDDVLIDPKTPFFDPSPSATGNLLTDGEFTGSGAHSSTRAGGNKPTNWTCSWVATAPAGGHCLTEVGSNTDTGGNSWDHYFNMDGTGAASSQATWYISATGIADGSVALNQWLFAAWEIEWLYDPAHIITGIDPLMQIGSGTPFSLAMHPHTGSQILQPLELTRPGERFWVIHEPVIKPTAGTLNLAFRVYLRQDRQGAAALRLRRAILRTTTNPAIDFPWVP